MHMSSEQRVLLVAGAGPGISRSTALLFGRQHGYKVVLISRTKSKLQAYAEELQREGVEAEIFIADLRDAKQVQVALADTKAKLGPVSCLLWCAYHHYFAEDILNISLENIQSELNMLSCLIVATQDLVKGHFPDVLASGGKPALLVVGGGTSMTDVPGFAALAVQHNIQVAALAAAAKRNFVATMAEKLRSSNIRIGEVIVFGTVKRTAFDNAGAATLDPDDIAGQLWRQVADMTCPRTIHVPPLDLEHGI